jgi:molybdopterin converting factor small subunit
MHLLFFGSIQEALSMTGKELTTNALNLGELKLYLEKEYPYLTRQPYTFAVNEVLVRDLNHPISTADTIALLPPFSGG